ncbi:hypothetical protein BDW74DRAFT_187059 [Aspergillus multicolor]|uniref:uncharacterized protein n=1 Tax=Aspergillus multicolor TaxID=41759 RepID=UPI003CCE03B5
MEMAFQDQKSLTAVHLAATGAWSLSNRVSYFFDLQGPSMTIKTACSSSLAALHEACQALRSGSCSSALVGGTSLIWSPTMTDAMVKSMLLSPDGVSRTFDAGANGYARGEGINCLYVKRLSDALRDSNPIRAVVRSTATNHDGRSAGFTSPSAVSQESLIRQAYCLAGINDISATPLFECHGTGTSVGGVIEATAIANVRDVKPNVGHSEAASGITSVIKAVLSLEHKAIAPNIHFENPNPKIPWAEADLHVPLELLPWPSGRPERVSVNSFGVGGSNAHAILESAPVALSKPRPESPVLDPSEGRHLLLVSAHNERALQDRISHITQYAATHPSRLRDLAHTLATRREHFPHRAVAVLKTTQVSQEVPAFSTFSPAASPTTIFVFTGQGAQWPGMGKRLLSTYSQFADDIDCMDKALQALPDAPDWRLRDEMNQEGSNSRIYQAEFAQPLSTAVQVGLCNLLTSWAIAPSMVAGHSSGEIAAAYAAGAISMKSAIILAYYRGRVAKSQEGQGAMVAVGLDMDEVAQHLCPGVAVACHNSPRSVTLSGDNDAVNCAIQSIKSANAGTLCRRLPTGIAYHSDYMKRIGLAYEESISDHIEHGRQMLPLSSSVTGRVIKQPTDMGAAYWRANLESPVLFVDAIQQLPLKGNAVFIEIGPHSATLVYIPTLFRYDEDAESQMLHTVGRSWGSGIPVDLTKVIEPGKTLTDLPLYPWQHDQPYWYESRVSREWRQRRTPPHELLGSRVVESTDHEPSWRNLLRLNDVPWLWDHVVQDIVIFPAAGYMALVGAAVRDLHPSSHSYCLRHAKFVTPLLLAEDGEVELITTLRPIDIADDTPSGWYGFTITAHMAGRWTLHCKGQVRAGSEEPMETTSISTYVRKVSTEGWYRKMAQRGLNFGPQFQGLTEITADPTTPRTSAIVTVAAMGSGGEGHTRYLLHPIAIDQGLQLMGLSSSRGVLRNLGTPHLPAGLDFAFIAQGNSPMRLTACIVDAERDGQRADATAVIGNQVVLSLKGVFLAAIDRNSTSLREVSGSATARIEWDADIDLLPPSVLRLSPHIDPEAIERIKATRNLCLLHILEAADRIRDIEPRPPHLAKWKAFIMAAASDVEEGAYEAKGYHNSTQWIRMSSVERQDVVAQIKDEHGLISGNGASIADLMQHVSGTCAALVGGISTPTTTFGAGLDAYHDFYSTHTSYEDWRRLLELLGHSNPRLRILEVGAGTGSATAAVLDYLTSARGERKYEQYTFTDISGSLVAGAKNRFGLECIEYKVLDITLNPLEQGFGAHAFDLIIAANVLHNTANVQSALRNIHTLLAPTGRQKPYKPTTRWNGALQAAGFTVVDEVGFAHEPPYQPCASFVARPQEDSPNSRTEVALITGGAASSQSASEVESVFAGRDYAVNRTTLSLHPSKGRFIVSLLDVEGSPVSDWTNDTYQELQRFVEHAGDFQILWVTRPTSHACSDPRYGLIHGLARTLRKEQLIDISILEVATNNHIAGARAVIAVCEKIQKSRATTSENLEYEFALVDGEVKVGRYSWTPTAERLMRPARPDRYRQLTLTTYGLLDTLHWIEKEPQRLLEPGQVEVEIHYAALNLKDMMTAMGFLENRGRLGLDGSGIVRRVGASVTGFSVGDRVGVLGYGLLASHAVVESHACLQLPDDLSLQDAVTMFVVYSTAFCSLLDAGTLREGQSVLIHSACGGVGLAALQICLEVGAEVHATVGTEEKAQYLMSQFGLARSRIYNSRDTSCKQGVMRNTNGRGVDLVLNSLSGKLLHASWECVAETRKLLELGKRDFLNRGKLDMSLFAANRSFMGLDPLDIILKSPPAMRRCQSRIMEWYREGKISPIQPAHVFDAVDIVSAFRYMQAGTHMGKIVVRMPDSAGSLSAPDVDEVPSFRPDAAYLLVGGLGGVGRCMATWMIERQARELVFLSPSAGASDDDQSFIRELEVQGCHVKCIKGSVTNANDVEKAVACCSRPLAGVLHLAATLRDRLFVEMDQAGWDAAIAPKVTGSWNLHHATAQHSLDFFVVFGSISGICGNTGQANYAAAVTFLEAFTRYRRQHGLPSSILHLGIVEGPGMASRDPQLLQKAQSGALHVMDEGEVIDALAAAINASSLTNLGAPNDGVLAVGVAHTKPKHHIPGGGYFWGNDARFSGYSHLASNTEDGGGGHNSAANGVSSTIADVKALLSQIQADPSLLDKPDAERALLTGLGPLIAPQLANPEERGDKQSAAQAETALAALTLDSLVSIELRSALRRALGLDIALFEINQAGTLGGLVKFVVKKLRQKYGAHPVDA